MRVCFNLQTRGNLVQVLCLQELRTLDYQYKGIKAEMGWILLNIALHFSCLKMLILYWLDVSLRVGDLNSLLQKVAISMELLFSHIVWLLDAHEGVMVLHLEPY
jgi:hypothetical protein